MGISVKRSDSNTIPSIRLNPIDKIVNWFNPVSGLNRANARLRMAVAGENGYVIPGSIRKSMKGYTARIESPARDIDKKLTGMRAASRDMCMNTSTAISVIRRYRTNVVSYGLQVQPSIDREFLGLTEEEARQFVSSAAREFDLWSNSIYSDYSMMSTPDELQALIYISSLIDGDCFFALPWIENKNWPYETVVKVISADLIRDPNNVYSTGNDTNSKIRNGVEFKDGRLSAYWIANYYDTDSYSIGADKQKFQRISLLDSNDEQQIFHFFDNERIDQRRGLPMLAPVIEDLRTITRLTKSELTSALIASMFTVFIKDQSGMGGTMQEGYTPSETINGGGGDGPNDTQEPKTSGNEFDLEMGPGTIQYLDDDKDISIAETRNKNDFAGFFKAMATQVSAATDIPYEIIFLEFQRSYSAMRGAINEAWKKFRRERVRVAKRICQPWYEAVIKEAILKGRIKAPRFFDDPIYKKEWCRAKWVGAGQGHIDPLKEVRASALKIREGLSTRAQEYSLEQGERWEPMIEQLAVENNKMLDLGLPVSGITDEELGAVVSGDNDE